MPFVTIAIYNNDRDGDHGYYFDAVSNYDDDDDDGYDDDYDYKVE